MYPRPGDAAAAGSSAGSAAAAKPRAILVSSKRAALGTAPRDGVAGATAWVSTLKQRAWRARRQAVLLAALRKAILAKQAEPLSQLVTPQDQDGLRAKHHNRLVCISKASPLHPLRTCDRYHMRTGQSDQRVPNPLFYGIPSGQTKGYKLISYP